MIYLATRPIFPSVCLSALSTFGSRANGVLLCMDVLCQSSLIHSRFPPTSPGLKILQTWRGWHCWLGYVMPEVENSGDGRFCDKPVWVAQAQIMESFECNKKTIHKKDGGCWRAKWPCVLGSVGLFYDGDFPPPRIMNSQSSAASHLICIS